MSLPRIDAKTVEPRIEIEEITPEYAEFLLTLNTGNFRKPSQKRIDAYAKDIQDGRWDLTGDSIKITDNILLDGQHRLLAVIAAGKPIKTVVAYNVAESSVHIDKGQPRKVSQWLSHRGFPNAEAIATTARLVLMHDKKIWDVAGGYSQITDDEIIDYAEKYREALLTAVRRCYCCKNIVSATLLATVIHIGTGRRLVEQNGEKVLADDSESTTEWFINSIYTGADLRENDPPLTLRNRLLKARSAAATNLSRDSIRWFVTLAWNSTVEGRPLSKLRIRTIGPGKQVPPSEIKELKEIQT